MSFAQEDQVSGKVSGTRHQSSCQSDVDHPAQSGMDRHLHHRHDSSSECPVGEKLNQKSASQDQPNDQDSRSQSRPESQDELQLPPIQSSGHQRESTVPDNAELQHSEQCAADNPQLPLIQSVNSQDEQTTQSHSQHTTMQSPGGDEMPSHPQQHHIHILEDQSEQHTQVVHSSTAHPVTVQ